MPSTNSIVDTTNRLGKDGICWFLGVVIDRIDPLLSGRVRVRIYDNHTPDLSLIPQQALIWAHVLNDIHSQSNSGIGNSPNGLAPGTHILGIFLDGSFQQQPLILGTLAGLSTQDAGEAAPFADPRDNPNLPEHLSSPILAPRKVKSWTYKYDGSGLQFVPEPSGMNYPRTSNPLDTEVHKDNNDLSRLVTATNLDETIIALKTDNVDTGVKIAFGGTWSEPPTAAAPVYPFNVVYQSESGTYVENDNTALAERWAMFFRTGSWDEMFPNGIWVSKRGWDAYKIWMKDVYEHTCGVENKTVQNDSNQLYQNDLNTEVINNYNLKVHSNGYIEIDGNANITVQGNCVLSCSGDLDISANRVNIKASGAVNIDAAEINLNCGDANPPTATKPKVE